MRRKSMSPERTEKKDGRRRCDAVITRSYCFNCEVKTQEVSAGPNVVTGNVQ
jgi:hypothetical protein